LEKDISIVSVSRNKKEVVRLSDEEMQILDFAKQFGQIWPRQKYLLYS